MVSSGMRMKSGLSVHFFKKDRSYNIKSKRRFCAFLVIVGVVITVVLALESLLIGTRGHMGIDEVSSIVVSIVKKGGHGLERKEMLIYMARLPKTVAAIIVGIGLSVAGAVYQAIFRNPLVEPYIMGVSSGAGTFAIAAVWMGGAFLGMNHAYDSARVIASSIVGGLLAVGCAMLIAKCAGGKSVNYVLAGVIVGMLFSAIQSVLVMWGCTKITSAISWVYGSFDIVWKDLRFVAVPIIILSAVPLIWARSLNLILLGEDQATQMGMNAKRFSKIMLAVVSVLTAFCVSLCGIIGFIGLIVPHISRILVGSDHRLMLPVSMVIGASLMLIASSLSKMFLTQQGALPVGMITTVIGVPIFAYLLTKRGYKYDGQRS